MSTKSLMVAVAVLAATISPSAAGWTTRVLWAYGVPGVSVGYYQQQCTQKSYPPYYYTYANVRAGQIWGSNVVTCYEQRYSGPR